MLENPVFLWKFLMITYASLLSISACDDETDGYGDECIACDGNGCTECDNGYILAANGQSCIGEHFIHFKLTSPNFPIQICSDD